MMSKIFKRALIALTLTCGGCFYDPGYDAGPPPPTYGYYGYGPSYPWASGVTVDINHGYGHGGYGGYYGGYRGGGFRGGGFHR